MVADPLFLAYLAQFDDGAWLRAVDRLQPAMHPVDRAATRAWFHFYPLRLQHALATADRPDALAQYLRLEGRWRLADLRDTSHWFLFGHRYWPAACEATMRAAAGPAAPASLDLAALVQAIARAAAFRAGVDAAWTVGIAAVALRTLQQVGLPPLPDGQGSGPPAGCIGGSASPDEIVAARDDLSQSWLTRLTRRRRQWAVTFDERLPRQCFPLIETQHLTTAAAADRRDYRSLDPRCTEGPIPVQCRSCSCGTCWVGVIAGADRLSPMDERERATLVALGYIDRGETAGVIRLSCMAEARGPVTIVIPPWNGQIGARLEKVTLR